MDIPVFTGQYTVSSILLLGYSILHLYCYYITLPSSPWISRYSQVSTQSLLSYFWDILYYTCTVITLHCHHPHGYPGIHRSVHSLFYPTSGIFYITLVLLLHYTATIPMDIPVFTGTHADLLITVFHKIITTGHQRLQPLFDCLYCCRNSCRLADHSVPQDHHYRTPEASATV
ncbi:uncharacterized protein LOC124368386 [Homalodisca vitripennis]|uniref:uncharacterized protein LOC124368386 n=1 Tax=Homalodisca vitripennis TaxID=197043 RepID=UPI001EEB8316|nr:uncharacterized protein LOC124368386 [Homalodisca vitripennis]